MRLKWPGFNNMGTLIIKLAPDAFCLAKNNITVSGETFSPKNELHITLIGGNNGRAIQEKIKRHKAVYKSLKKNFEEIDWSYKATGPVHILSRTKDAVVQKSIIVLLEMPGIEIFYQQLKSAGLIDSATPVQPAHVTLYTQNCALGIGVPGYQVLDTLSVKTLPLEEITQLCKQVN